MSIAVFHDHIEQIWNKGDASAIQRFIAPNYLGVDPAEPEPISGVEGYRQHFDRLTTAFPDTHITIDHIIGVNDQVAARLTVEATHTGDFGGIPPTGRPVSHYDHRNRPDHQRPDRRRARQLRRPRAAPTIGCHRGSPQGPRTAVLIRHRQRRVAPDTHPADPLTDISPLDQATSRRKVKDRGDTCTPDPPSRHLVAARSDDATSRTRRHEHARDRPPR